MHKIYISKRLKIEYNTWDKKDSMTNKIPKRIYCSEQLVLPTGKLRFALGLLVITGFLLFFWYWAKSTALDSYLLQVL